MSDQAQSTQPEDPAQTAELNAQEKIEHLKMIQEVIKRLAGESAHVKTWSAALVTGLLVAARLAGNAWVVLVALVPVVMLASLDAYYLGLERKYRRLFEDAAKGRDSALPWTMSVGDVHYLSAVRLGFRMSVLVFFAGLMAAVVLGGVFVAGTGR